MRGLRMIRPGKGGYGEGETAATRALHNGVTAATTVPTTGTDGVICDGYTWAIITLRSQVGTSFDAVVYTYDRNSELWDRDTQLGSATGAVTVTTLTRNGIQRLWFDVSGIDRIEVGAENFVGANEAASVWVALSE